MAFVGGHERFERAAEHFGIDGCFGPARRVFVCGKPVAIEQVADQCDKCIIGEAQRTARAFEWCGGEEPTVQERDLAECARGAGAFRDRRVERSEEEGAKQAFVQRPSLFELPRDVMEEKLAIAIQPALGFEEGEEETAGGAEEGELASFGGTRRTRGGERELMNRAVEGPIEACRERLTPEDVGKAGVPEWRVGFGDVGERAEGVGIGVDDASAVDAQCSDARTVRESGDYGDGDEGAGRVERHDAPIARRRVERHTVAQLACSLARVTDGVEAFVWREHRAETTQSPRSASDLGLADQLIDRQRALCVSRDTLC